MLNSLNMRCSVRAFRSSQHKSKDRQKAKKYVLKLKEFCIYSFHILHDLLIVVLEFYTLRFCVEMYSTLLPRMNASPYLFFSCPFAYSSVWSRAMFMYPSRHARTPTDKYCNVVGVLLSASFTGASSEPIVCQTKHTSIIDATVQLHDNRPAVDLVDELRQRFFA